MPLKPLPIYGDGMQTREWVYVSDRCVAINTVLSRRFHGYPIREERPITPRIWLIVFGIALAVRFLNLAEGQSLGSTPLAA